MHNNFVLLLPVHLLILSCVSLTSNKVLLLLRILSNIILLLAKTIRSLLMRKLAILYRNSLIIRIILLIITKLSSNISSVLLLLSLSLLLTTYRTKNALCIFSISSLLLRWNSISCWWAFIILCLSIYFTLFIVVRWIIVILFNIWWPVDTITKRFSRTTKNRERPQVLICAKDLIPIINWPNIIDTLVRPAFFIKVFNCGFICLCQKYVEL